MIRTIIRLSKAFLYSWNGLQYAFKTQWAFRLELLIFVVAIPFAWYLADTAITFILLMFSIAILPMMELINSAIETTLNRISLEYHELTKAAKDMGSAALFIAGLNVLIIWGGIFIAKFFNSFF